MKVKFYDGTQILNASIKFKDNLVTMITDVEPDVSGFNTYSNTNILLHKYPNYTTLYRKLDNGFQLSNDGSIYIPPEPHHFTHTPIGIKGITYDGLDYNNLSFYLSDGEYDFSDVSEITVGGKTIRHLKFNDIFDVTIDNVIYKKVSFIALHQFTHTPIIIDDEEYDALDYTDYQFCLVDGEYDFSETTGYEINGRLIEGLIFEDMKDTVINDEKYKAITFRIKTDEENIQQQVEELEMSMLETYEEQMEINDSVESTLLEIWEYIFELEDSTDDSAEIEE